MPLTTIFLSPMLTGMRLAAVRSLLIIATGIFLAEHLTVPGWVILIVTFSALLLIVPTRGLSVYLMLLCAAFLYRQSAAPPTVNTAIYNRKQFQGTVIDEPLVQPKIVLRLLPPLAGKVIVWVRDSTTNWRYGDRLRIRARIKPFSYPRNPGLPDYNRQLADQGFVGHVSVSRTRIERCRSGRLLTGRIIMSLRRHLLQTFRRHLPEDDIQLLIGLLLGEKEGLSPETVQALTATGLWHLLAVSGLHVGIIVLAINLVLSVIGIRGWLRFLLLTFATLIYTALAGWQPAAVRSAIMSWAVFLSLPLQRPASPLTNLGVAGILILLFNPAALASISTQLSFAATFAIISLTPKIQSRLGQLPISNRIRNYLLLPVVVSLTATLGTAPLLARYFYRFQPLSFLASLPVIPLVTMIIPLGLLVALCDLFSPVLATILAQTLQLLLFLTRSLILLLGRLLTPTLVITGRIPAPAIWYWYGLLFLLVNWQQNWARPLFRSLTLLGALLLTVSSLVSRPRMTITFLDPGAGDAILIEDTLGRKLLIDAGIDRTDVVSDYLLSRRIRQLDAAIITHPDRDHYGGLLRLDPAVTLGRLIVPVLGGDTGYTRLLRILQARGTKIETAGAGDELLGFGFRLRFLAPDRLTCWLYSRKLVPTNQVSIVNLLSYSGTNLLLTGDFESVTQLQQYAGADRIHILKSPHHGSRRGNPPELYAALQPEHVVVMGRHPTPAQLESILPAQNINYLNTRRDGGIILRFHNGRTQFCRN